MRKESETSITSWGRTPVPQFPRPFVPERSHHVNLDPPGEPVVGDLHRHWTTIGKHKWLVLACALGCGLAGLVYSVRQTPIYVANTTVEIAGLSENTTVAGIDPSGSPTRYPDDHYVQTQMELLHSRALFRRVLNKLGRQYPTPSDAQKTADRVAAGGLFRRAMAAIRPVAKDAFTSDFESLTVRVNRLTRVIDISFESPYPQFAANVANGMATEFIGRAREVRWETVQQNSDWMRDKLEDLRKKLAVSEDKLQQYAASSGLIYAGAGDKSSISVEKLRELQTELSKTESDLATKRSRYEAAVKAAPDSVPEVLDDPSLRDHQMKLAELRRQHAELSTLLTPENYKVQRVQAQIDQLENMLRQQRSNILNRIRIEYDVAQRKEKMLASAYLDQDKTVHSDGVKGIRYDLLRREADANRQLYDSLLQKVREAGITSALNGSTIRVVDPAMIPTAPIKPNTRLNILLGLAGGLFAGVLLAFFAETGDKSIHAPGEGLAYLNIPEVGTIPRLADDPQYAEFRKQRQKHNGQTILAARDGDGCEDLAMWHGQSSLFTESFRATAMSLLFSRVNGASPRVVAIASALPREGKSTVVSNLAVSFAGINRRTLVIDGDMRRPRLHHIFGVDEKDGLKDLLLETQPVDQIPLSRLAHQTSVPNVFILPAGVPTDTSRDIVHSERLESLLTRLRKEFDMIIIDTPPMLHIPDARALGCLADGVVLLVRAGVTSREAAQTALDRLEQDGTRVFGMILNDWTPRKNHAAGYYDYYRQPA